MLTDQVLAEATTYNSCLAEFSTGNLNSCTNDAPTFITSSLGNVDEDVGEPLVTMCIKDDADDTNEYDDLVSSSQRKMENLTIESSQHVKDFVEQREYIKILRENAKRGTLKTLQNVRSVGHFASNQGKNENRVQKQHPK